MSEEKDEETKRRLSFNSVLSLVILVAGLAMMIIPEQIANILAYFIIVFLFAQGVSNLVSSRWTKKRYEIAEGIISLAVAVLLTVVLIFLHDNRMTVLAIAMGMYCVKEFIEDVMGIFERKETRLVALGVILALMHGFFAVELFLSLDEAIVDHVITYGVLFVVMSAIELYREWSKDTRSLPSKVIVKIVEKTNVIEIVSGLFLFMVISSYVLLRIEENVTSFDEALWYCFTIATSIGSSGVTLSSNISRAITVFMGIYGLIVIAVVTAMVICFYLETGALHKEDAKNELHAEAQMRKENMQDKKEITDRSKRFKSIFDRVRGTMKVIPEDEEKKEIAIAKIEEKASEVKKTIEKQEDEQ